VGHGNVVLVRIVIKVSLFRHEEIWTLSYALPAFFSSHSRSIKCQGIDDHSGTSIVLLYDTSIDLNRCRFDHNRRRSSFERAGRYPRGTAIDPNITKYYDMECRDGRDEWRRPASNVSNLSGLKKCCLWWILE
jgi:hypothetical protein